MATVVSVVRGVIDAAASSAAAHPEMAAAVGFLLVIAAITSDNMVVETVTRSVKRNTSPLMAVGELGVLFAVGFYVGIRLSGVVPWTI